MTDKPIHYVKMGIYAAGLIAFLVLAIQKTYCNQDYLAEAIEVADPDKESEEFWPPDMIPHPGCPGDGPQQPNDSDLA